MHGLWVRTNLFGHRNVGVACVAYKKKFRMGLGESCPSISSWSSDSPESYDPLPKGILNVELNFLDRVERESRAKYKFLLPLHASGRYCVKMWNASPDKTAHRSLEPTAHSLGGLWARGPGPKRPP